MNSGGVVIDPPNKLFRTVAFLPCLLKENKSAHYVFSEKELSCGAGEGESGMKEEEEKVMVKKVKKRVWPFYNGRGENNSVLYARIYSFKSIPPLFFSELFSRLSHFLKLESYFANEMEFSDSWKEEKEEGGGLGEGGGMGEEEELNKVHFLLEESERKLYLSINTFRNSEKTVVFVVEVVDQVVRDWYGKYSQVEVVCTHCLNNPSFHQTCLPLSSSPPFHSFPLLLLEELVVRGEKAVGCGKGAGKKVSIALLAPDVFLSNLHSFKFSNHKLVLGKKLGEGAFAEVFKGELEGSVVAVKKLFGADTPRAEKVFNFSEAFNEVPLLSLFILFSFSFHSLFILFSFSFHSLFILFSFSLKTLFFLKKNGC